MHDFESQGTEHLGVIVPEGLFGRTCGILGGLQFLFIGFHPVQEVSQQSQRSLDILFFTLEHKHGRLLVSSKAHLGPDFLHRRAKFLDIERIGSQFTHILGSCTEQFVLQGTLVEIDDEGENVVQRIRSRIERIAAIHLHLDGIAAEVKQARSHIPNGNLLQALSKR